MNILKLTLRNKTNKQPIYVMMHKIVGLYSIHGDNMAAGSTLTFDNGGSADVNETCFSIQCKLQEIGYNFLECQS